MLLTLYLQLNKYKCVLSVFSPILWKASLKCKKSYSVFMDSPIIKFV